MNPRSPVFVAVALATACGYRPAKVQYEAPKEPAFRLPHSTHVDADVACTECHADIASATKLERGVRHIRIPSHPSKQPACSGCHDTDPAATLPAREREFRVRFSHADHLKLVSDCKRCHVKLTEAGDTAPRTPPMETCTSCHVHQAAFAEARCMPCHVDLKGYKPETAFRHEGQWIKTHGGFARPSAETCVQCHDQTYCAACHSSATAAARLENLFPERVDRAFIHRGDYVSRHMIDAGAHPESCRRCHGSGFCGSCHALEGVESTGAARIVPSTHDANWVGQAGVSPNRHGAAARRDISSCAACHDQGASSRCASALCHGDTTRPELNPHPKKFLSTHDRNDIAHNSMCRVCHK